MSVSLYHAWETKHENFNFVHLLSFLFIKNNWNTILCMRILNIPNNCSADEAHSYLFELHESYYWQVVAKKLPLRLFTCLVVNFWGFSSSTPDVACIVRPHPDIWMCVLQAAMSQLATNIIKQKLDYSFLYLLGLQDQSNATEEVDIFWISSLQCDR